MVAQWLGLLQPVHSGRSAVCGIAVFPNGHCLAVCITITSISNLLRANIKGLKASQSHGSAELDGSSDGSGNGGLRTFVEVEIGNMSQRTDVKQGSNPNWNASFDMVLPESSSTLHMHLYEWSPNNMKLDCLTSCEIQMTHVADDSIIFWAIEPGSTAIARQD